MPLSHMKQKRRENFLHLCRWRLLSHKGVKQYRALSLTLGDWCYSSKSTGVALDLNHCRKNQNQDTLFFLFVNIDQLYKHNTFQWQKRKRIPCAFPVHSLSWPSWAAAVVWRLQSVWCPVSWPPAAVGQQLQLQPATRGWAAPVALSAIPLSASQSS